MGLFEKRYRIIGRDGDERLTAKELYKRVLEDSKSNCNLISSATELVRVCNEPFFSEAYAREIKIAILNFFANLELKKKNIFSHSMPKEEAAVYSCYNSLSGIDKEVILVKEKYLKAIISSVVAYTRDVEHLPTHQGFAYEEICEEWKNAKFSEYVSKAEIDFFTLRNELYTDFEKTIEAVEAKTSFAIEDAEYDKKLSDFIARFNSK